MEITIFNKESDRMGTNLLKRDNRRIKQYLSEVDYYKKNIEYRNICTC